ncbi:MAG: APC family permease [bacterium]|nr:APC family permease [bacterium]
MEFVSSKREIGKWTLVLAGATSIIGSAWLFAPFEAAKLAGPAAIISWIIGGAIIMLIALTCTELGTMFPKTGSMVHYLQESHGPLTGFMGGWANWVAFAPSTAIEAVASTQYLSSWNFAWTHALYSSGTGDMTIYGLMFAGGLMFIYFFLNYWSMQLFLKSMVLVTCVKLFVPLLTIVVLAVVSFHISNFTSFHHSFAPYHWSAVLAAVPATGIVFCLTGYQTVINLAGEAKNPGKSIPFAVITCLVIGISLYVLLQIVFIAAVNPAVVAHGWSTMVMSSPFAQLAIALNLNLLMLVLYFDAFVSPSGCALAILGSCARMLFGMEKNKQMPKFIGKLHKKTRVPRAALWVNLGVSFIFLFVFRGWSNLATAITVAFVISFLVGPIGLSALRIKCPEMKRPFKLPFASVLSPIVFILCSLLMYWARWPMTGKVLLTMLAGMVFYFYYQHKTGWIDFRGQLRSAMWLIVYMGVMAIFSYIGGTDFGGLGLIPNGWGQLIVVLLALVFYYWGVKSYYKPKIKRAEDGGMIL